MFSTVFSVTSVRGDAGTDVSCRRMRNVQDTHWHQCIVCCAARLWAHAHTLIHCSQRAREGPGRKKNVIGGRRGKKKKKFTIGCTCTLELLFRAKFTMNVPVAQPVPMAGPMGGSGPVVAVPCFNCHQVRPTPTQVFCILLSS